MTFLPIVERELRVAARRHSTFWVRLVLALAAIAIGFFLYLANAMTPRPLLAKEIFGGLGGLALLYCVASGRRSTADCLSEEKRDGTLGLLFLTDLKGYDVVLGKLAATSLNAFYGLLAILPVLAIPMLLGGVTNGEFWRLVLVLVTTILFSLAIGVLASVLSRDARQAMGLNLLLLLFVIAIPPAIAGAIAPFSPWSRLVRLFLLSCPGYGFYLCFDGNYQGARAWYWLSVIVIQAVTWVLVMLASWLIPRSWQDRQSGKGENRWADRWRLWLYGKREERGALRAELLGVNPFCWLASRVRFKRALVWAFLALMVCWWVGMSVFAKLAWHDESFTLPMALLVNATLKLWIGIEAGQRLAEERRMGSLELLLSTPLNERQIMRGQFLALRRQFVKPLAAVLCLELLFLFAISRYAFVPSVEATRQVAIGLAGIALFILDTVALYWVALWTALAARVPTRAGAGAILRVLVVPWVLYALIAVIASLLTAASEGPSWQFFLGLWFVLGVLTDVGFGLSAWRRLHTRFREQAMRPLMAPRGKQV